MIILADALPGDDALDERTHGSCVDRIDELAPEDLPADAGRVVSRASLEGDVGARDPALVVDQTDEARHIVRDRVQECAIALLLGLEPVALGDVEAARHDARDSALLVDDGALRQ